MDRIAGDIECLLRYALDTGLIDKFDVIFYRNYLLDLLDVEKPAEGYEAEALPLSEIMDRILAYCSAKGLVEDTITAQDAFEAKIMGALMPRDSEIIRRFWQKYEQNPQEATDDFVRLCEQANYIQVNRIRQNIQWQAEADFGMLDITINLSKPEKDPKEIAAARTKASVDYPKCLICKENMGFAGDGAKPARQNLRMIPLELGGEEWFFQYSPYAYYQEHCIILKKEHEQMRLTRNTFVRLLDFLEQFPHYFIGSNADIPIVGGSILTHDHFQGGRHVFPLNHAKILGCFSHRDYPGLKAYILDWPLSVIRVEGERESRAELEEIANALLECWRHYSDQEAQIQAYTGDVPHNTITPIARVNDEGKLEMDLVLRNNRTTKEHPLGIFHPHQELHHIKKENIGLIEVMGLAILPGRLKAELAAAAPMLCEGLEITQEQETLLKPHLPWLNQLAKQYGVANTPQKAQQILRHETGMVFAQVLEHAGVFKGTAAGRKHFLSFMKGFGFEEIN